MLQMINTQIFRNNNNSKKDISPSPPLPTGDQSVFLQLGVDLAPCKRLQGGFFFQCVASFLYNVLLKEGENPTSCSILQGPANISLHPLDQIYDAKTVQVLQS